MQHAASVVILPLVSWLLRMQLHAYAALLLLLPCPACNLLTLAAVAAPLPCTADGQLG